MIYEIIGKGIFTIILMVLLGVIIVITPTLIDLIFESLEKRFPLLANIIGFIMLFAIIGGIFWMIFSNL